MKRNKTNGHRQGPKAAGKKNQQHKRLAPTLACFRSAISNGSTLFVGVDQRSAYARRFRDVLGAHVSDLGGRSNCSEAELSLIRRATTLTVILERMENKFAEADGEACNTDLITYQRVTSALRRVLESLGLRRRPRDITPPNPLDYAKAFDAHKEEIETCD
jgi:hypothetical protein